jgi:hypothetical protein
MLHLLTATDLLQALPRRGGVRDPEPKPDDAILIDLMLDWAPDEAVRNRILVDNAAKLYDFPKS